MSTNARRLGQYELQQLLGKGSMAEVWKAYDAQLHRYVAIKILHANLQEDPNFMARFEREARLAASLHHPNIVQVHDFQIATQSDGTTSAYMVMEYIDGQNLAHYIDNTSRKGLIPQPNVIVELFTSIGLAVTYAHQKGMIHRDLKPANILLDARNTTHNAVGEPILTDFGFARLLGTSTGTFTHAQLTAPLYASPEQASGYAGNERSDIYSLGIILYVMVTGALPFQGDDPITVMAQQLNTTPVLPRQVNPNIPPALEVVLLRCLAKDPGERFPTALSLAAAIAEALNLPVPERLGKPSYPDDVVDMPTYLAATPSALTPLITPAMQSNPSIQRSNPFTPLPSSAISAGVITSTPPRQLPTVPEAQLPPPPVPPGRPTRRRTALVLGTLGLIILVVGASLGVYFLFLLPASAAPDQVIGHAFYVSSGQLNDKAQGIADELQVDLTNVQAPPTGKSYYLWLLGDKDATAKADLLVPAPIHPPILITNDLPVHNNTVHFTYAGDAQHNNLLSETSRLLITLEAAGRTPTSPSTTPASWVYYAQLPQVLIPNDPTGLRGLDHIRHLYYNEDHIKILGLYGGLDIWTFRNTEKILEWSTSVRDDFDGTTNNYSLMHNLFISMLDYLDGIPNVHVDVPAGTPITADANIAAVSLLTVDTTKQGVAQYLDSDPPGDLDHMTLHLSQLIKAPDASAKIRTIGQQVLLALGNAKGWLQQVRVDAKKLFDMTPAQLAQPAAQNVLEDLVTQATYAYIGQLDPATNQTVPGILQAHYDIQQLATFDITAQVPKSL